MIYVDADVYLTVIQSINISGDVLIGQLVYIILYVTIVGLVPDIKSLPNNIYNKSFTVNI